MTEYRTNRPVGDVINSNPFLFESNLIWQRTASVPALVCSFELLQKPGRFNILKQNKGAPYEQSKLNELSVSKG